MSSIFASITRIFFRILAVGILDVILTSSGQAALFDSWLYRAPIQAAGYSQAEPLTNFPVLVKLGTNVAGFSYVQFLSGSSDDLRFTDVTRTNALPYEIESWDTNGISQVWVRVPVLTNGTLIHAYWGQAGQTTPSYATNGTMWAEDFIGIWHLKENPAATTTILDSTSNQNHGTCSAGMNLAGNQTNGVVGNALFFDGANDYVTFPNSILSTRGTVSLWFKFTSIPTKPYLWDYDNTDSPEIRFMVNAGALAFPGYDNGAYQWNLGKTFSDTVSWHYLAGSWRDNDARLYVDGVLISADTACSITHTISSQHRLGWYSRDGNYFPGYMDEFRESRIARSSNWIWAVYLNQASNGVFWSYGTAQQRQIPVIENRPATGVTVSAANLNGYLVSTGAAATTVSVYWGDRDGGVPTSGLWQATNIWAPGFWTNGTYPTWPVMGLTSDRVYFYRYDATNAYGRHGPETSESFLAGIVSIGSTPASEVGPTPGTFSVWRASTATGCALTVNYAFSGDAVYGTDYVATVTGSVLMAEGATSTGVVITPIQDPFDEAPETVVMTLLPGTYALDSSSNAVMNLSDAGSPHDLNRTTGSGVTTNDWFSGAAWTLGHPPLAGEDVVITNALILTNATAWVRHCLISNTTVMFSNWTTRLWVGGDLLVTGSNTRLTVPGPFAFGQMSNRVHLVCSNLTLATGVIINVTGGGYLRDTGPGKGAGASYGDSRPGYAFGAAYGSVSAPTDPGSGAVPGAGGTLGGHGGGAVRIEAEGTVTIHGSILANGTGRGGIHGHGGSGGSIYINCRSLGGSAAGLLQAKGEDISHGGLSGSGGRIAVIYDPATQAGVNPGVRFNGQAGRQTSGYQPFMRNFQGTIYFSDNAFLSTNLVNGQFFEITYFSMGFTNWSINSLVVSNNSALDFGGEGFSLTVGEDVVIGAAGELGLRSQGVLSIGGDLSVESGGRLVLRSGETNSIHPDAGLTLAVAGAVMIASNGWINPWSHVLNGGSPVMRMRTLAIDPDGGIDGSWRGFGPGLGYGKAGTFAGAGYGGKGGYSDRAAGGNPYGLTNMPLHAGSGGGTFAAGGALIKMEVTGGVTLNGKILANGAAGGDTHQGGGSGGGIFIQSGSFKGNTNGLLQADGGTGANNAGGGGGGGRIALWTGGAISPSLQEKIAVGEGSPFLVYTNCAGLLDYQGSNSVRGALLTYSPGLNGSEVVILFRQPGAMVVVF